jgi:hypothetical protein
MDLLLRGLTWLVRFTLDRAAFADRLGRFIGISDARRGLDCGDRTRCEVHFARRFNQTPALDDSQLRSHCRSHHSALVPAPNRRVPLAIFGGVSSHCVALLDS